MTDRPRETMAQPVGAGHVEAPALPFDPTAVRVDELPARLASVDDVDALHRLQRADTRTTAAAHYERRVNEITAAEAEE